MTAKLNLKVSSHEVVGNLEKHAELALKDQQYGTAALIYTEISARVSGSDPKRAAEAERQAYVLAAKQLGEEKGAVFDPNQSRFVILGGHSKPASRGHLKTGQ
jgi:hypothetical protein